MDEYVYSKCVEGCWGGGDYILCDKSLRCITKTCILRLHLYCLFLSVSSSSSFRSLLVLSESRNFNGFQSFCCHIYFPSNKGVSKWPPSFRFEVYKFLSFFFSSMASAAWCILYVTKCRNAVSSLPQLCSIFDMNVAFQVNFDRYSTEPSDSDIIFAVELLFSFGYSPRNILRAFQVLLSVFHPVLNFLDRFFF